MATPIFLYPSLTNEMRNNIFQSKKYGFSYADTDGMERDLEYESSEISSAVNCLRTDGIWSPEKHNLRVKRTIALRKYRSLFGSEGLACKNARLGVSLVWTSSDSRQRGAVPVLVFGISEEQFADRFGTEKLKSVLCRLYEIDTDIKQGNIDGITALELLVGRI